jgi:hypothetical protein
MAKFFKFTKDAGWINLIALDSYRSRVLFCFHPDEFHDLQVALGEYMKEQLKEMYTEPEQKLPPHLL